MPALRLTRPQTKDFSLRLTILGGICIFFGIVGVTIGTLLAKARIPSSFIYYKNSTDVEGYNCNTTVVYPGQTFSGRGSFWYQAVNSFEYDGRSLNNCSVRQYNSLKVMGPPMSQPAFFWDDMMTCTTTRGHNATFTATYLDGNLTIWNQVVAIMGSLGQRTCNSQAVSGFIAYESSQTYVEAARDTVDACFYKWSDPQSTLAEPLMTSVRAAIQQDFDRETAYNILPGILYPCTKAIKVWAPVPQIAWDLFTSISASLSVLFFLTVTLLKLLEGRSKEAPDELRYDSYTNAENDKLVTSFPPNSEFGRREGLPLLAMGSAPVNDHFNDNQASVFG